MNVFIKSAIFIAISTVIIIVSRRSLRKIHAHGFYRFLAWELIAALFALNIDRWFHDPWTLHQIFSWVLLCVSLVPLAFGVYALKTKGKAVETRQGEPELLAFEKTSQLVTTGIFRYIRHPLYSSLLFLTWGIFFKSVTWYGLLLAVLTTEFLFLTAKTDEIECVHYFGAAYNEYMSRTKRFIPFII
jgi:protein-S-isoprenylcysteine O-methyltransferase Ste14